MSLNIVTTQILVKGPKTSDGRQTFVDYGFCYASINGVGGVMLSGDYIIKGSDNLRDIPGDRILETEPVYRDVFSNYKEEAFGFINK